MNQRKNNLELAACQQSALLNQRAMEVANMEQSSRHQAIQQILDFEAEAKNYVRHCEYEMKKQTNLSLTQESLVATMKSEYSQRIVMHQNFEHALAEQKRRNLEVEVAAQRVVEQQQSEIAQLAKSTLVQQNEHEVAQRAIQDAKHREQQLLLYH